MSFAFQIFSNGEADFYGEPYDLKSVMHYNSWAFAANTKQMTIQSKSDKNLRLGNNYGFIDTVPIWKISTKRRQLTNYLLWYGHIPF